MTHISEKRCRVKVLLEDKRLEDKRAVKHIKEVKAEKNYALVNNFQEKNVNV